jgi:hypothetical protein
MNSMSAKTEILVSVYCKSYAAWQQMRLAAKAAEFAVGRGAEYNDGYDEVITACNTFAHLTLTSFRTAVAALQVDVLAAAEVDADLMAVIDAKGEQADAEAREYGDGYCRMPQGDLRAATAYCMAVEFVEQRAGVDKMRTKFIGGYECC